MANRKQRFLAKNGLKSINGGASTTITKIEHGPGAFLAPDKAAIRLKEKKGRSWKATKRHPGNPVKKDESRNKR